MQAAARCRAYRAKNLEEIRRKDREAKRAKRQKQRELLASQALPMGEFEGSNSSHLYLLRYSFDPCQTMGIKIGKSENVAMRKAQLEEGHCFEMKILRVYSGCGHLESMVHKLLATKRLTEGSSREWFDVSFDIAMLAVRLAYDLDEDCAFNRSETTSSTEETQPSCTQTKLI